MQFKRLQSKNGTSDLINKLEVVIDDDENYLVQIILMYDNCNNNIETLKNKVDKKIDVYLCLTHDLLVNNLYGKSASNDEIQVLKNKLLEPIILFTLFLGDNYDQIEEVDKKNEIILSFCNTFYITNRLN